MLCCTAQTPTLTYGKAKPTVWAYQPVKIFGQRYLWEERERMRERGQKCCVRCEGLTQICETGTHVQPLNI